MNHLQMPPSRQQLLSSMAHSARWDAEGPDRGGHFPCVPTSLLLFPPPASFTTSFPSTFLESTSKLILPNAGEISGNHLRDVGRPALSFRADLGWHPRACLGAKHTFGGRISVPEAVSTVMAPGAPKAPEDPRRGPSVTVEFSASTVTHLGGWAALLRNPRPLCIIPPWIRLPPNPKRLLCKDESLSHSFSIVARAHFPYCSSVDQGNSFRNEIQPYAMALAKLNAVEESMGMTILKRGHFTLTSFGQVS